MTLIHLNALFTCIVRSEVKLVTRFHHDTSNKAYHLKIVIFSNEVLIN